MTFSWKHPVPIYCPVCYKVDVVKDFQSWFQFQRFKWEGVLKNMPDSIMKRSIQSQLARTNDLKKVREVLIKEGYLIVHCEKCQVDISHSQYQQQGFSMIRIKNFLFEEKWFDTHKEDVYKTLGIPIEKK